MTQSNFIEDAAILRIGTVYYVAPDKISVSLDIEAPSSVALNAKLPRPFPRVNGYVLVSADGGYLVGQVEWITIENAAYPKRKGFSDFGIIDLPYPARKMQISPLGMLRQQSTDGEPTDEEPKFKFERGVNMFPSVGSDVVLPTENQLRAIIQTDDGKKVKIGTCPLLDDADVYVNPDHLFGRHLAVLGNTGSGKSCTVAGLVRWSLQKARDEMNDGKKPNARFIILDPNGEYKRAFAGLKEEVNVKIYSAVSYSSDSVSCGKTDEKKLRVPMWFWNDEEWSAITRAQPQAQRPVLQEALRLIRGGSCGQKQNYGIKDMLYAIRMLLDRNVKDGLPYDSQKRANRNFTEQLQEWERTLQEAIDSDDEEKNQDIVNLTNKLNQLWKERISETVGDRRKISQKNSDYPDCYYSEKEIRDLLSLMDKACSSFATTNDIPASVGGDTIKPFPVQDIISAITTVASIKQVSKHVGTLLMRINSILSNRTMSPIISDQKEDEKFLAQWLNEYIGMGEDGEKENNIPSISIIDLSLIPSDVVHVIVTVIARMVFDALQRYRRRNDGKILPTVLVMEEAHNFIKRHKGDSENLSEDALCCKAFERIAREGRKFGLGMVVSSQRPSELSPTVLSQCNSFLIHRISNDRDQETVSKLVPDNLRGLLRELPSLPSQRAILLGWASDLPLLVRINDLNKDERPASDDPPFWRVWTGEKDEKGEGWKSDWGNIAKEWQE